MGSESKFIRYTEWSVSAYDQYLFAQDPTGPAARDYFVPDNQLPPLIQSGFNPSFITTLSHER